MTRPLIRFTVHGEARPKGSTKSFAYPLKNKTTGAPVLDQHGKQVYGAATTSDNPRLKGWEETIRGQLQRVMSETAGDVLTDIYTAPVAVTLVFHLPRPKSLPKKVTYPVKKPDLDKLARGAIDALNGVLFKDDSQVVMIETYKRYADGAPCVEIQVEQCGAISRPAVNPLLKGLTV